MVTRWSREFRRLSGVPVSGGTAGSGNRPPSMLLRGPSKQQGCDYMNAILDGARQIRVQLATGYTVLLCGWMTLPGLRQIEDPFLVRLGDLFSQLGPASRSVALTFLALLMGGAIGRLFLDRLLDWIELRICPSWDAFIQMAVDDVCAHDSFDISNQPNTQTATVTKVPSGFRTQEMGIEVANRRRSRSDARFRVSLLILLVPVLPVVLYVGGFLSSAITVAIALLLLADVYTLGSRTARYMNLQEQDRIREALNRLNRDIGHARDDEKKARISARCQQLEEAKSFLEKHPRAVETGITTPGCGHLHHL